MWVLAISRCFMKLVQLIFVEGTQCTLPSKNMSHSQNYITINNPNIEVLCPEKRDFPLGEFIPSPLDDNNRFDSTAVNVHMQDMYLPNFSLRMYQGETGQNAMLVNKDSVGTDLPGSCIFLKGKIKSFTGSTEVVESFNSSQNFKFDPHNELEHFIPAARPFHYLHLSFTFEYFNQIIPECESWGDYLREKIQKKERILGDHFAPLALAQERAIQNILDCPLSGKLGLLMMETSIIQILLLQMHLLFSKVSTVGHRVSRRDLEMAHHLKEYLSKSFLDDHSLANLAMEFGTNTNKLMQVFKKLFGKSIFDYLAELRMEHARQLLREQKLRVVEVARTVGYKNPNHFSTAFKRRYGYIPSEVR